MQIDSTNQKLIKLTGIASFNLKDYNTSETCFLKLLSQGDTSKFNLKHLGISQAELGSFHDAREHLLIANKKDTTDFEVCYMLGRCYLNSMNPETGLYYFNRVDSIIHPSPDLLSSLYYERQSIYSALNMPDSALYCYQKAYEYKAKPEYLFYMGSLCLYKLNKKKQALEYFEKFLAALPQNKETEKEYHEEYIVVSFRKVAENNIRELKEQLFFEMKK